LRPRLSFGSFARNQRRNSNGVLDAIDRAVFSLLQRLGRKRGLATAEAQSRGKASFLQSRHEDGERRTIQSKRHDGRAPDAALRYARAGHGSQDKRSVVVRINDRGPFIKGRIIDVSRGAAQQLGMIGRGVAQVEIRVV
jgi:rare lipoprotein A